MSTNNRFLWKLEAPQYGASNEYPQHVFFLWRNKESIYKKIVYLISSLI